MRVLLSLLYISALCLLVSAVPAGSIILPGSPAPLQPVNLLSKPSDPGRPWTRLRDWVIESVWARPRSCPKHLSIPTNVRDRYGSDVVLRFRLRHPDDAEALAVASRVLVLDVWAITAEYVDIRLAEDMV